MRLIERWVKGKDTRQNLEPYRDALIKLADSLERSEAKRVSRTSLLSDSRFNSC